MKNYLVISFLVGALFFTSCEKYLDVMPKTQIPEKEQFSTEQGFKDALTGVYISAKTLDTYGKELAYGTIESLISSWDVTTNTADQQLGLFNYGDDRVINRFNRIFERQYSTIAHANAILQNLETNKSVLITSGLYELIKAECLAMRAYIHFDLMRLYGPVPEDPTKGNKLAYVTNFDREINAHISYDAFKMKVLADIKEAAELIKAVDPLLTYSMAEVRSPITSGTGSGFRPTDTFFAYRNMRMNYYAIRALEARANLWYGNKEAAYVAAKEVVEAKNADGSQKFKLATGTEYSATNYILTTEHLLGLYAFDMAKSYTGNFGNATYKKGTSATTIRNQLYGNTGTDFRESSLWNIITLANGSTNNVIRKYWVTADNVTNATDYKQMPLLRTSEMYLILAETAPFAEGVNYLKTFRTARNISNIANPQDYPSLVLEVIKEYRKEFYAEGQAFYAYKRLNAPKAQVLFVPAAAVVNYLLPMPTVETIN
ncbi:RagB/SusD family nutrient uptake outer membrane protein [Sphingobacterium psychroaquaticum]|uniref:SusD family protein n=1 Tax=Sphingobacterium psychroaquaticum TaxID=561061 RepID=A0A1X7K5A1_9SPHI|nr:RagB/SusD family nutrient uptake outer membrane protein [Sphingobacterium psychroaquaticum]SMG35890.1 SusD family protein [Sphingobacterium psychroaquaticum]